MDCKDSIMQKLKSKKKSDQGDQEIWEKSFNISTGCY